MFPSPVTIATNGVINDYPDPRPPERASCAPPCSVVSFTVVKRRQMKGGGGGDATAKRQPLDDVVLCYNFLVNAHPTGWSRRLPTTPPRLRSTARCRRPVAQLPFGLPRPAVTRLRCVGLSSCQHRSVICAICQLNAAFFSSRRAVRESVAWNQSIQGGRCRFDELSSCFICLFLRFLNDRSRARRVTSPHPNRRRSRPTHAAFSRRLTPK